MKFKIIPAVLLLMTLVLSCEKNDPDTSWLYIEETHCSNAWDESDGSSTRDKVTDYLKSNGIKMYDFEAEVYSTGPFCEACICPTGRNIRVLIPDEDINSMKSLGFKE